MSEDTNVVEVENEESLSSKFKVHIEKKIYLEADDMNYILKSYSGNFDKNGKETFKALGYYGSLKSVVADLIKTKTKESTATTLKELLVDIKRIEDWVKSILGDN